MKKESHNLQTIMHTNMNQYKVVVVDVDGTLVTTDKHVTQVTKEAIIKIKEQGVLFGVATGRAVSSAMKMLKRYNVDHLVDFLVCSNGVEIVDLKTNHSIITFPLSKEDLIVITDYMKPAHVDYCLYHQGFIYTNNLSEIVHRISVFNDLKPIICPIEQLPLSEVQKIVFAIPKEKAEFVKEFKKSINDPKYSCFFTQAELFEFVDYRVSKAAGILAYIQEKGFKMDNVVTFGDAENDSDMLKEAGLGVAMGNAPLDIQTLADVITKTNDEDGVAFYLNKLFDLEG